MIKLRSLLSERYFMFAYQTHNGKYKVKGYRLGKGMTSPAELVITNLKNGTTIRKEFDSEGAANKAWKALHKANLR